MSRIITDGCTFFYREENRETRENTPEEIAGFEKLILRLKIIVGTIFVLALIVFLLFCK